MTGGYSDNTTSLLKWSEVDSLGTWNNAIHSSIQMRSEEGDTYILLKIKLNATRGYDRLHERVLEVCTYVLSSRVSLKIGTCKGNWREI